MLRAMKMKWYLKRIRNRLAFDELEYGYGEFTFRVGTKELSLSDIHDTKFHSILQKFSKYLKKQNVTEMLIGSG